MDHKLFKMRQCDMLYQYNNAHAGVLIKTGML